MVCGHSSRRPGAGWPQKVKYARWVLPTRVFWHGFHVPATSSDGAKREPTMLPGHGSAFLQLPCRRRGRRGGRRLFGGLVGPFGGVAEVWGIGWVSAQEQKRKTIKIDGYKA
jgi:hypothetical protein